MDYPRTCGQTMVYYEIFPQIFHAQAGKDGINRGLWIEILQPHGCMMNSISTFTGLFYSDHRLPQQPNAHPSFIITIFQNHL